MKQRGEWRNRRLGVLVALGVVLLPAIGRAIAPLLVMVGKQIVQDTIFNAVKGQLIASLAGMGCKGSRLAGLVAANAGSLRPGGGLAALPGGASMPNVGAAMGALPTGSMPGIPTSAPGMAPMGVAQGARALQAAGSGPGGMDPSAMSPSGDLSQAMMAMQAKSGGGTALSPDQMARAQEAMRRMQVAMAQPLSRAETLEVFDQLKGLGVLTDSMHAEARDCITLAPEGSDRALGQTGAVFKQLVLPQLQQTKARLEKLGPEEQDQLAQGIADALRSASPADREAFRQGLGAGFFPRPAVEKALSLDR